MGLGRATRKAVIAATAVVACGAVVVWATRRPHADAPPGPVGVEEPVGRDQAGARLTGLLGHPAVEVIRALDLGEALWYWTDEPPGVLRGVTYYPADGRSVTLYVAEGEPLFRRFDSRCEWDYAAFLRCRVGGFQYRAGGTALDIGPAVPWQWRRGSVVGRE